MKTSRQWFEHFEENLLKERINWSQPPQLEPAEQETILRSLQAWQLGETSEAKNLLRVSAAYAQKTGDDWYLPAMRLFVKEEQKHGNNLGRYLDMIGQPRIKQDLGDSMFRRVRYFNSSMEIWTMTVITVESTAQVFYQSLKQATRCPLLRAVCTDILIDEAAHIRFQSERLATIFQQKHRLCKPVIFFCYAFFFFTTAMVVWAAHRKVFAAGGYHFSKYMRSMKAKFLKTIFKLALPVYATPIYHIY